MRPPENLRHPNGLYYILGRLMANLRPEVRDALTEDILEALAEGYELPEGLVEWLGDGFVITRTDATHYVVEY